MRSILAALAVLTVGLLLSGCASVSIVTDEGAAHERHATGIPSQVRDI